MGRRPSGRTRVRVSSAVTAMAVLVIAGCGDDDKGADEPAATEPATAPSPTTAAADEPVPTDGAPATTEPAADAPATTAGAAAGSDPECPDPAAVSAALGVDVIVDDTTGASMAGFCPYTSGDGTGDISLSVTYTPIDVTAEDDGAEPVDGLGERALWYEGGELSVWTGDTGIIVSLLAFGDVGQTLDDKAASIAVAEVAIDLRS